MIRIKNSFSGVRSIDEESGLPVTTKTGGQGHGLGLVNIRKTAQKYQGDIDIEQDNKELSVMLLVQ